MVTRRPNRGATVRNFTAVEVEQIYFVRELLERAAVEVMPLPISVEVVRTLEDLHSRHCAAVKAGRLREVFPLTSNSTDLAVRIGREVDEGLIARPLGVCRSVLCASPSYLARYGLPDKPEQLANHRCITHAYVGRNEFVLLRAGRAISFGVRGVLQSNETAITRQAALEGGGVALLPTYFVSQELARGELVRVLPDYEPELLAVHAVYLSRAHQPLLLRLMVDFLAQRLSGPESPWDRAAAKAKGSRKTAKRARRKRG